MISIYSLLCDVFVAVGVVALKLPNVPAGMSETLRTKM